MACELLALGAEDVLALHLTRWGKEPWALGSYSLLGREAVTLELLALELWSILCSSVQKGSAVYVLVVLVLFRVL